MAFDDFIFYKAKRLPNAAFHDGPIDLTAHEGARITRAGTVMAWLSKAPERSTSATAAM
jgi:hypothetical protein